MGRKSKTGVLKRLREVKKAEKAAQKRELKLEKPEADPRAGQVATDDEMAGYGFPTADEEPDDEQADG